MNTIFGKIISGDIPADIVHEDELVIAFRDVNPQAPVHVLIIPKQKEIPTLNEAQPEDAALLGHMMLTAANLARAEGIDESGYRLVMNCNAEGGQTVYHLHLHLVGGRQMLGF